MKKFLFLIMALAVSVSSMAAEQSDAVVSSIRNAYQQAKASIKADRSKGNEMVASFKYTVRGKGLTTETVHFFYVTDEGTYLLADDGEDPHFNYYPLYFVTRSYNLGNKKYYEEYLFDKSSQRLIFVYIRGYDANGKRAEQRLYYSDGDLHTSIGPSATSETPEMIVYTARDLRNAFDWLIRNPKE